LVGRAAGGLKEKCPCNRYCGKLRGNGFKERCACMNKRELIDRICEINKSAKPEFLATFSEEDLYTYLEHLMELNLEELVVYS
jgi:hypothetical protein